MEQDQLHSIASSLFQAMALSSWKNLSLDVIEGQLQRLLAQLGNVLMESFILPQRVADIEQQVESASLLCSQCGGQWQIHKHHQQIHPKTIFGKSITISRTQYFCPTCQTYLSVADQVLELPSHRMTPRLATLVALCGASWSYPIGSAFLEFLLGVELADKTVERITKDQALLPAPLPDQPLTRPPEVVTADGVLVRGRKKDSWLEMKVASFFSEVVEVSQCRRQVQDASFVAWAVQEWREFVERVTVEAHRRGLNGWEEIEFVSDGAEGIWQMQEMIFPKARKRLDLYHSKCKVGERIKQAYRGSAKKEAIEEAVQEYFEKGMIDEAISYLKKRVPRGGGKKEAAKKLMAYLERHRERIPNYEEVKKEGGTVSSGLMEKANDLIVCRRMKEGEMHWTREGAGPVVDRRQHFISRHAKNRTGAYDLAFCRDFFQ